MRNLSLLFVLSAAVAGVTACSPYSPDLSAAPFLCGPAVDGGATASLGVCPEGFTCTANGMGMPICIQPNGTIPIDSNTGCADDRQLEPNDTIQTAFVTPVATTKKTFPLSGLAICPAGDKDTYSVQLTAVQNFEVIVIYDAGGATLQASILNSGGIPIANASAVSGMTNTIRADAANLPVGIYYAQVYGPGTGTPATNNYKLTINVTP